VIQQAKHGRGIHHLVDRLLKRKPQSSLPWRLANRLPHRLKLMSQGELRRRADARRIGIRRLRDQPVGEFAYR